MGTVLSTKRRYTEKEIKKFWLRNFLRHRLVKDACRYVHITRRAFNCWLRDDPDFRNAYESMKQDILDDIRKIAYKKAGLLKMSPEEKKAGDMKSTSDGMIQFLLRQDPEFKDLSSANTAITNLSIKGLDASAISRLALPPGSADDEEQVFSPPGTPRVVFPDVKPAVDFKSESLEEVFDNIEAEEENAPLEQSPVVEAPPAFVGDSTGISLNRPECQETSYSELLEELGKEPEHPRTPEKNLLIHDPVVEKPVEPPPMPEKLDLNKLKPADIFTDEFFVQGARNLLANRPQFVSFIKKGFRYHTENCFKCCELPVKEWCEECRLFAIKSARGTGVWKRLEKAKGSTSSTKSSA
ncbi:MAG: hypothetical protein QME66_05950 [Candidatus Eisenbacteria bacterium]|nr:hypothetical protein [Candidatus Eisenbacteria bacterium]